MKKSILSLSFAMVLMSFSAFAGNMNSSSKAETTTTQERMEDGSVKSSKTTKYEDREPSEPAPRIRKTKTTTKKIDEGDMNDNY